MKLPLMIVLLGAFGGCASVDPADSVAAASRQSQPHTGQALSTELLTAEQLNERLREPLTADAAVQLALQNNRSLQARLARLGVTAAEVTAAGRLPNPGFSFSRLSRGSEIELEHGWHLDLARLLTLPLTRAAEQRRLQSEQQDAAAAALTLAADTRRAWVQAVAASETLRYRRQVLDAAEAGAELARRMQAVGNFSPLQRAREQAFEGEAQLGLARALQADGASRERLIRLLGLWGDAAAALRVPARLPELPAAPRDQPDIEALALSQRLDVQAARLALERAGQQLENSRRTRFVSMLDLGLVRNSSNEQATQRGWEVTLELPLFGSGQVPRAEALAREAAHQAAATAINARSEVREAYGAYRSAYDIARHHRDELVPLAQRIADEQLLRYNGMLIGVFELLADARSQIATVSANIDALRDFWLAQAQLDQALIGPATLSAPDAGPAAAPAATPTH
jgi:outer membrane protein TolC